METKQFYNKILRTAKKINLINRLGGKCSKCGETRHWLLEFHHEGDKEFRISSKQGGRISVLEKEIDKCICLCSNCHREEHDQNKETKYSKIKIKMLEYKQTNCCQECGYSKLNRTLDFHHINSEDKNLSMSNYRGSSDKLSKDIELELDNCIVLCSNCHKTIHYDLQFFEDNKEYILEKSKTIKEIQSALDKDEVKRLFESGMKPSEIAKKFSASKGTISGILKSFGLTKSMDEIKINREEFAKLHSQGLCNKELETHFKINKATVFLLLTELNLKSNVVDREDIRNGNLKNRKFNPTKQELFELLKTKTQREIASSYSVSQVAVCNAKKRLGLI